MRRNLLMIERKLRLPLEYPFPDFLKIYASRLLVTGLIYIICLSIFLVSTGQIVEFRDRLVELIPLILVYILGLRESLLRRRSESADDEIDE